MTRFARIPSLLLIVALVLCPSTLYGKGAGAIKGKIAGKDGQELFGAVITIFKKDQDGGTISFTRSNRRGFFSLDNISPGSYLLQISRDGYRPYIRPNVTISPGKTISLQVILQDFLDLVSADDPRNWDLSTVLRSTSSRRLIFRNLEGQAPAGMAEAAESFVRGGTVNVASSAGLSSQNYSVLPSGHHNGIVSNFAFVEPVGGNGRMIFAGQLNSGYDTLWRVRNTFKYRTEPGREFSLAFGYGRLNLNGINIGNMVRPTEFFSQDPELRESGVQTISMGVSSRSEFLDMMELEYGFDLARIYHGLTKSVISPHVQFVITPANGWRLRSSFNSRRITDNNSVALPGGELVNLSERTYLAKINGKVYVTEFKHSELALGKELGDTLLELAVYRDSVDGPGTPFLLTIDSGAGRQAQVAQLREEQAAQHGMRFVMNRNFMDFLEGSIAYTYGTASNICGNHGSVSGDFLAANLLNYIHRSNYHTFMSQLSAQIPHTQTNFTTILRWYPGNPLTPIDFFYDRIDSPTKGVNFAIRQAIPLPEFLGKPGRWEALVDVRNLFDQGRNRIPTGNGELVLNRNPRSLRFGLNLNFY
jgi:hypothetical protein